MVAIMSDLEINCYIDIIIGIIHPSISQRVLPLKSSYDCDKCLYLKLYDKS